MPSHAPGEVHELSKPMPGMGMCGATLKHRTSSCTFSPQRLLLVLITLGQCVFCHHISSAAQAFSWYMSAGHAPAWSIKAECVVPVHSFQSELNTLYSGVYPLPVIFQGLLWYLNATRNENTALVTAFLLPPAAPMLISAIILRLISLVTLQLFLLSMCNWCFLGRV